MKRSKHKRIQYWRVQLLKTKRILLWLSFVFVFYGFYLSDFVEFKNKLRTIEPRFWQKKLRTIQPHFEKQDSYLKKKDSVMILTA